MKTLYLDISSGISGDMFLGALIDLGADFHRLERDLARLRLEGYHLHAERQQKQGIEGIKFDVHLESAHSHEPHLHPHPHDHSPAHHHSPSHSADAPHGRTYRDIKALIQDSPFTHWVKHRAIAVFNRVAQAEGKVHGHPPDQVHFHEVGAVDSIVDIVGACLALEQLGKPQILSAPVVEGTGWVECAHGRLPVPVPATLEILSARGVPISQCEEPHEMVTPTGAALLAEFAESFGPLRNFGPEKVAYGLGTRETQTRPNVLRIVLGRKMVSDDSWRKHLSRGDYDWETDTITTLQTNLDDLNAEVLGRFMERAMEEGALDAFFTAIQMKKSRPGVLLTVLCQEAEADRFSELILRETSAFGVRRWTTERRKLRREIVVVRTPHGEAAVKQGKLNGQLVQVAPEFESCKKLADANQVPIRKIYEEVIRAGERAG